MTDRLRLKPTAPDSQAFITLYDHPVHGPIAVGRISTRASLGNVNDPWQWTIQCSTLAPVYSPNHGRVPNDQRTWVKREAVSFTGTAPTLDEALADWKEHWQSFVTLALRLTGRH